MTAQAQQFASDNYAGACPEAIAAMLAANAGSAVAYGDDDWTQAAADRLRTLFATDAEVFFVFNGTAANSLALASLCQSYHSVICSSAAHVETDECGAPEFLSAPWIGLIDSGAWLRNAEHGNSCARRLADRVAGLPGVALLFPVQANSVFLVAPERVLDALRQRGWRFYTFIGGGARFMFAWDADVARVDALAADIRDAAVGAEVDLAA